MLQLKKVPNFDEAVADVDSGYAKFGGFVTDVMASCQTFLGLNNDSNSANAQASGDDANKGSTGASGSGKNTFVPVPNLPPPSPKMSPQSGSSSPKGHNFSQGYGLLTVPRGVPGNFGAKGTTTALLQRARITRMSSARSSAASAGRSRSDSSPRTNAQSSVARSRS